MMFAATSTLQPVAQVHNNRFSCLKLEPMCRCKETAARLVARGTTAPPSHRTCRSSKTYSESVPNAEDSKPMAMRRSGDNRIRSQRRPAMDAGVQTVPAGRLERALLRCRRWCPQSQIPTAEPSRLNAVRSCSGRASPIAPQCFPLLATRGWARHTAPQAIRCNCPSAS